MELSAVTIPFTNEDVAMDFAIDDIFPGFSVDSGVDSEILNPLPSPLTPLRTPVHPSMDNDETVLELHPSPTPALEEADPTVKVSGKIRSPIRTPRDSKTDRKRESPSGIEKPSSGTSSGSRKENVKRPSDDEVNKAKKRAKESNASSASSERTRSDDRSKFKIPMKPVRERENRCFDHHNRQTSSSSYQSRPTNRGRDYVRYDDRGPYSSTGSRHPGWNFSERIFDRPPAANRRICHLSEEQFKWLNEMPPTRRR